MKRICRTLGTIALGSLIGSCGDGPTEPPTPTTATVVMSAATASLVPAASTQLSATARDQSGQPLARVFTWMSSDPGKATVSSSGMVVGVAPGTATITAGVDGKSASTAVNVLDGGVVSNTGATLQVGSGVVQIIVPPGAVSSATNVSVVPSTAFANEPRVVKGTPFDFGPSGTTFAKPVSLTLKYDPAVLSVLTQERSLRIHLLEGTVWQPVEGSTVDLLASTVTAQVSHFSTYAILTPVPVSSVTVTLSPETVFVGQASQAAAVLKDLGGNILDGRIVAWSSSNTGVATVDPTSGLVTGVTPGTAEITATSEGMHGKAAVTVNVIPVATVLVSPPASSVVAGATQQLSAETRDAGDNILTGRSVNWSSSDPAVASVSVTGLVAAVIPGNATITATSEGKSGTSSITVTAVPVGSITVTPGSATLTVGGAEQITATLRDVRDNVLTGRPIVWTSSAPSIASVSATGLVTALLPGDATISATSEGQSAASSITVVAAPVASVVVSLALTSVEAGQTTEATATTFDAGGGVLTGRTITWSSDNTSVASVSPAGLVTAVSPGTASITATSEGKDGSTTITITQVPVTSVTVALAASSITAVETTQATATTLDGSGGVLTGRAITWSSNNTAVATVSSSGLVTAISAGTANITATSEGKSGSATLTLTHAPVASVSVTLAASSITAVGTTQATATLKDAQDRALTGRSVVWSSDNTAVATVSSTGLVTAVSAGTANLIATSEGQSAGAALTVTQAPVASVTVALLPSSISAVETSQATAVTRDAAGGALPGREITWSSDNSTVATVSAAGVVTAVAAGTTNITAASEGKTGSATLTVTPAPVASVSVGLASSTITAVGTTQASATLLDAHGGTLSGPVITWMSDNLSVATVSSTGFVTAVAPGAANITATSEGKAGSALLTVTPAPVATVTVSPVTASIVAGSTEQLSAEMRDGNNNVLAGRPVTWSSSDQSVTTVSNAGLVTAVAPGSATITATSESKNATSSITVTAVPVATVTVSLIPSSITAVETSQANAVTLGGSGVILTGRPVAWSSDNAAVAVVNSAGLVTAVGPGTGNIVATSEGKTGSAQLTVTPAPVVTVTVNPASATVTAGSTEQLGATARDAHNTVLSGRVIDWSSSAPSIATVSAAGLVTALAPGTATITATSEGQSGTSSITVTPAPVASVTVALAASSINAVETTQATATTLDGVGGVLTGRLITWSSNNTSVATISSGGLVTAVSAGTATITATSEGKSGSAGLTVTPAPVATVTVSPTSATVASGGTEQLSATLRDAHNNLLSGRVVSWSSSAPAIATVSSAGLVAAVAEGSATITATSEGQSASSSITVTPVPVATVSVSLALSSIHTGQTGQATATTFDAGGGVLTGRTIVWSSGNTAVATVSSAGLVTAVAPGTATITATSDGKSGSATLTVTPVPVATVTVSPPMATVVAGFIQQLSAETRDAGNNVLTGRTVTWSSSDHGVATVSATGLVTAVAAGSATITATSEGQSGASSITVTPVPVASVTVALAASSINAVETTQATATTLDGSGGVLTGRTITWNSSNTAVATVSSSGLVTAISAGTANIGATSEGKSGSATLTVAPAPVVSVSVTLGASSITAVGTTQATATLKDAQNRVLTGRSIVWSSDNIGVATVSSSGLVTAVSAGTANITATSEGKSGSAPLTVTPAPVATITVSPPSATVTTGTTEQLSATLRDAHSNLLTGRVVSWNSSAPSIATVAESGLVTAVAEGSATITATSEGQSTSSSITVTPVPVATVSVSLALTSIQSGQTTQATATTFDAGGGVLTGRTITWTSTNLSVATVSSAGVVTAITPGTATITGTSDGKSGSATLTVTPVPVASVTVSPPTASVIAGFTQQLTAEIRDAASNVLTGRPVTWSSDAVGVATVSLTGLVTGVAPGSATITATSEGQSGTSFVTVTPVPVASVTVALAANSINAVETTQATAMTLDGSGGVLTGRTIAWSSGNTAVATVSSTGLVTAVSVGIAQIIATSEGKSGSATLTITDAPVATVSVALAASSINAIQTSQATATARDANGVILVGRTVIWSSDNTAVATVSTSGLVTAVSTGTANITATSEGKSASAQLTVTPAPVVMVTVSPSTASVLAGSTRQLSAALRDAHGNLLTGRMVSWSSSNESVATVSASGLVTAVAVGSVTITATSEGQSGSSSITVSPAPVASVTVALASSSITAIETTQASAATLDAGGGLLTGRDIAWTSSNVAVATVSSTGLVTAVGVGSANITATSEGKSGSATITITPAPVASVTVALVPSTITAVGTAQAAATTRDAAGGELNGRDIAWSSDNTAVATVSTTGLVTAVSVGTAQITAVSEGKSGSATVTVTPAPVASVSVALAAGSITAVQETQASETLRDANGGLLTGRTVTWSSDNTSVATVSSTGLVTAIAIGTANIIATSESQIGSATLTVTPAPVATVTVSPAAPSIVAGNTEQLIAELTDSKARVLVDRTVTWVSDNTGAATVSSTGLVTAVAAGTATITATSEGQTGTSSITVTPVPVASVSVALVPSSITAVGTAQATATTLDSSGGVLTGRAVTWSSDNEAAATVSSTGLVTAIATGTANIIATSEGQSGSSTLTVTPAPVATVTMVLAASSISAVETTQATATLKDAQDRVLTGRSITWSSDNTAVASVSSTGLITAIAAGTANISATSESQSGTAAVTVTPAPVAIVTVSPTGPSIVTGYTEQLTVTLKDAQDRVLTGRTVTWGSDNTGVATVSSTGLVTAVSPGTATVTATSEGVNGSSLVTATAPISTVSLLRRSTQNPRYFENASGQIVYLTGSHTWSNLQDNGTSDPPAAFNYTAYLDFLTERNHNFFRLWAWEQAKWTAEFSANYWITPGPFARTGPANALDGKPKFDLTQFNQAYFDRLRQRVIDAGARGIYVSVMLFDGWSVATKTGFTLNNPWQGHPFNAANNVNGINGDTNGDGLGLENQTLGNSAVTALQEAYVRKVIDAVGDLDNVLYEISNESDASSRDWQYHMIQVIRNYEATRPKQHPVGMTAMWPGGSDADLTGSTADWISASGTVAGTINMPSTATGSKVLITDTDHLCGICGDMAWVWKSFTKGHNPILMDGYDDAAIGLGAADYDPSDPRWGAIRKNMGYARSYAQRMDLAAAAPHGDLVESEMTGYALAKPGSQYLVFVPNSGSVRVNLTAVSGSLNVEWFNPVTGIATQAGTVAGGASRTLAVPFSGPAVLFLY